MMDIKDIIKWFIPCFHILLKLKLSRKLFLICLLLFLQSCAGLNLHSEVVVSENKLEKLDGTKSVENSSVTKKVLNQSGQFFNDNVQGVTSKSLEVASVGRTFGRPFKKMIAGLLPVIFQIGAASTWAVVAALVGVKTLLIATFILKLLLIAGAAKIGALFAGKTSHQHHHEPPLQKEIHLHIHNGGHEHHEEHVPFASWSRESTSAATDPKIGYVYDLPYRAGPQTISTPYGNYVRVDSVASTTIA